MGASAESSTDSWHNSVFGIWIHRLRNEYTKQNQTVGDTPFQLKTFSLPFTNTVWT